MRNEKGKAMKKIQLTPTDIHEDVLDIGQEHIRLSFLLYHDPSSGRYFIKSLDFSVDSEGKTIEECKENIQEAILIHFEDCQEDSTIFDPADKLYWEHFVKLKIDKERKQSPNIIKEWLISQPKKILKYA
jgi:predicted RNase H-like HicB family nuclease